MLSINSEHKSAIIRLINSIISESPLITSLSHKSKVNHKLVKLIHFIEMSVHFSSGNKWLLRRESLTDSHLSDQSHNASSDALIENWLLHYYFGDAVMESFAIEDGIEQELSTASLLILYVINKLSNSFPHIIMYFNENWRHLQQFNSKLDLMLRKEMIQQSIPDNSNIFETKFNSQIQAIDSTSDHLNSFCKSNQNNHQNDDILCLNSQDEVIVPQLLNSEISRTSPNHLSLFEKEVPQRYSCNECERCFGTRYKLTRHEFVHKPASKPLKCTWIGCDRRFRGRYDRDRHLLTHTKERPFHCTHCIKTFSRSDKLKAHRRKHFN